MSGDYTSELKDDILNKRRSYFEFKVKKPLMKSIVNLGKHGLLRNMWELFQLVKLCSKFPEPAKKKCKNPDSLVLLDIWDEFFKWEDNAGRNPLFRAIRRVSVGVLESDNYYAQRGSWWLMKLTKAYMDGKWQPNPDWSPMMCWRDPATNEARVKEINELFIGIGLEKNNQLSEV